MSSELPSRERDLSESAIITALREKGIEDPEVIKLVGGWFTEQMERAANQYEEIMVGVSRAEIFVAAGFMEEAAVDFEEALSHACQEGDEPSPMQAKYKELEAKIRQRLTECKLSDPMDSDAWLHRDKR